MKNGNIIAILNVIAAIGFLLAGLIGKNYVFLPIGCCFVVLAAVNSKLDKSKKNSSKGSE